MIDLLKRKNYLRAPKTIGFVPKKTDNIQISGNFNVLSFSLRGTLTRSGVGVKSNKGVLEAISRMAISSTKRGVMFDITGAGLYYFSRSFFASDALTGVGTAASVADVGFEASLPVSCSPGESITIQVTFCAAFTTMGTLITAYGGTLSLQADVVPGLPEMQTAMVFQPLGANGVIGAGSLFSQPNIPVLHGFALCGFMIESDTAGRGTLTNAVASVVLTQGTGIYKVDTSGAFVRHEAARTNRNAIDVGIYPQMFAPYRNSVESQLNVTAGAVATVTGSEVHYIYVRIRSLTKTVSLPEAMIEEASAEYQVAPVSAGAGQALAPPVTGEVVRGRGAWGGTADPYGSDTGLPGSGSFVGSMRVPARGRRDHGDPSLIRDSSGGP